MKIPISLGLLWVQEIRNWSDHIAYVENNIWHSKMKYRLFVLFSYQVIPDSLQPHGLQHTRFPCPPQSSKVCSNSHPLSQWCFLTISSSATPFSFCRQSFPALTSFPVSWLFASGNQNSDDTQFWMQSAFFHVRISPHTIKCFKSREHLCIFLFPNM